MDFREQLISITQQFESSGLSVGASGNASVRTDNGFLITPTGLPYNVLQPSAIVECDYEGQVIQGKLKPSSEWRFHSAIYQSMEEVKAIVHVHSPYATGVACNRQSIPGFHYMVTKLGGDSIRCAEYATFGTEELSTNAISALNNRKGCLLANHGQIATGINLDEALENSKLIEDLAHQYCIAAQLGNPVLLTEEEMNINIEKFKTYGKQ